MNSLDHHEKENSQEEGRGRGGVGGSYTQRLNLVRPSQEEGGRGGAVAVGGAYIYEVIVPSKTITRRRRKSRDYRGRCVYEEISPSKPTPTTPRLSVPPINALLSVWTAGSEARNDRVWRRWTEMGRGGDWRGEGWRWMMAARRGGVNMRRES